jgi:hypothetical protein
MARDMSEEVVGQVCMLLLGSTYSEGGNRDQGENNRYTFKSHNMTQTISEVVHVRKSNVVANPRAYG